MFQRHRPVRKPQSPGSTRIGRKGVASATFDALEPRTFLSASLVADINTTPGHTFYPLAIVPSPTPGVAYVSQHDGVNGVELWRTDGTPGGTSLVKDIFPGLGSSVPLGFVNVGSTTYFVADDGTTGYELWRTDGTESGTWRVKDIRDGSAGSSPSYLTAAGNLLYFFADDGVNGRELWKSDGTESGTTLVSDLRPGATGQSPRGMAALSDGSVIFTATNGNQSGLYRATSAGVTYISPASTLQVPSQLTSFGTRVYFTDAIGYLWSTDGTNAGTTIAQSINSAVTTFASTGTRLFFTRTSGPLYMISAPGAAVSTIASSSGTLSGVTSLCPMNGTLYFFANTSTTGTELFKLPSTSSSASLVKDITTGTGSTSPLAVAAPQSGSTLYFVTGTSSAGYSLYSTQGTSATTQFLSVINAGGALWSPSTFAGVGSHVVFVNDSATAGPELWSTDDTSAGASMLGDYYTGTGDSLPFLIGQFGNAFLLQANDGIHGIELWTTDGSSAQMLSDINPGSGSSTIQSYRIIADRMYFSSYAPATGRELYITDGTPTGTTLIKDIRSGTGDSLPSRFTPFKNWVYFFADNAVHGNELWRTDGTAANTLLFKDIQPGSNPSADYADMIEFNGYLYFTANDGVHSNGLWRTDGTTDGTTFVKDLASPATMPKFFATANALYFISGGAFGTELWRSDGTPDGTVRVTDINPNSASSSPSMLTELAGNLYFTATDASGPAIWRLDAASPTGASLVFRGSPSFMKVMNNQLFFDIATAGQDLYKSDGTAANTTKVLHIADIALAGTIGATVLNGQLFFGANTGPTGSEIWVSDGTAAGTHLTQEITPGSLQNTDIARLIPFNNDLYFGASDSVTGGELWKLTDTFAPYVTAAAFSPTGRPGSAGTITITVSEKLSGPPSGLTLTNLDSGQQVTSDRLEVSYDPDLDPTHVYISFRKESGPPPDGNYRLTLPSGSFYDASFNAAAADFTFDFFVLAADANRDRSVDFNDLVVLAQNYNSDNKSFAQGDFNYDGTVDFNDLVLLAQRYNTRLPAPAAPVFRPASSPVAARPKKPSTIKPVVKPTRAALATPVSPFNARARIR